MEVELLNVVLKWLEKENYYYWLFEFLERFIGGFRLVGYFLVF